MAAEEVDVRLVDPTEAALAAALRRAHAAANRGVTARWSDRLDRDAAFWGRFARDCLRGPDGRRRSCRAGPQTPEVIAGWWTDPAGRRHVRVVGRTRSRYRHARLRAEGELRDLPPWWQVYPEAVLAVRRGDGREAYLAACRCGAVGSPAALGWMGDACGPCFDRRADGGAPAGGFGHFGGWAGWHARVGFSADGARLIGPDRSGKLRAVSRADRAEAAARAAAGAVVAVAGAAGGDVFGQANGGVYRWAGGDRADRVVGASPGYGRLVLSPDGRRAVVLSAAGGGYAADLSARRPRYAPVRGPRAYAAARFTPDGARLLGVTLAGQLVSADPATFAGPAVRENVFDGLSRYGFPHDLSVSPDGAAAAVVWESHYPQGHAVRLLPLAGDRPRVDLPLPLWHRPTVAAFAPDGAHLATADPEAGWVGFWRLPSGRPVGFVRAVPEDPGWRSGQVVFSPDGGAVAVLYAGSRPDRGSTVAVWPWPDVARAAASEEGERGRHGEGE